MKTKCFVLAILLGTVLGTVGCDLDTTNPNATTDKQVFSTADGLKALGIGLQGRLGNSIEEAVYISGLVSGELGNTNATSSSNREFQNFPDPGANAQIEDSNPNLTALWTKHFQVVKTSNDILSNVDNVQLDPGTRSGLKALAKFAKAFAVGTLVENFQQVPTQTQDAPTPNFVDRSTAISEALALLADAAADLSANPPSSEFTSGILASGFDLTNSITALRARLSLINGDYSGALTIANSVPVGASAVLVFASVDPNPLYSDFTQLGLFKALDSFRANAEAGDNRVDIYTTPQTITGFGGATLNQLNVYLSDNESYDVFTQSEMTLIRAEANARTGNLAGAISDINIVRSAAGLPDKDSGTLSTQQLVLDEILLQRTYELYLRGVHWGDLRRFGRVSQAKVAWLPYPFSERVTNPGTPPNP